MPSRRQRALRLLRLALYLLLGLPLAVLADLPAITLIIDDMGNDGALGKRALDLPGPVTYAFLPHTPHAFRQAQLAHAKGKEVMLHLPMQAVSGNDLGPGALSVQMTEDQLRGTVVTALASVPYAAGVNNHMGSLLTRHPGAMRWLMLTLRAAGGLYFVDSRTTTQTVAEQLAGELSVPVARRDVFLDNERDPEHVRASFRRLLAQARKTGYAIGIGHPYAETLQVLAEELPALRARGVRLLPASQMIELQTRRRLWHASSSPSRKVAKNSKQ